MARPTVRPGRTPKSAAPTAVAVVLRYLTAVVVLQASSSSTRAVPTRHDVSDFEASHLVLRKGSPDAAVKVEVFLDLTCLDSAAVWPMLKNTADDHASIADFAFRILPLPSNYNAFEAAKAVQVVRAFPGGSDEDVETFIDRVFDEQHLISHAATVDMTRLEVREILGDWASVRGTMTFDQFNRGMENDTLDQRTMQDFEIGCEYGVSVTPTVFVDGFITAMPTEDTETENLRSMLDPSVEDVGAFEIDDDDAVSWAWMNQVLGTPERGKDLLDGGSIDANSSPREKVFIDPTFFEHFPRKHGYHEDITIAQKIRT